MITWKALLKDKTMIYDNFSANRKNIERVYITVRRYIFEDPNDNTKELNLRKFTRKYKTEKVTFKRIDTTEFEYDVKDPDKLLIQEAYMQDVLTGVNGKVGLKLTIDGKVLFFDDLNNTIEEQDAS